MTPLLNIRAHGIDGGRQHVATRRQVFQAVDDLVMRHVAFRSLANGAAELRGISKKARNSYLKNSIGAKVDVIVTSAKPDSDGMIEGFSDTAISVSIKGEFVAYGDIGSATISEVNGQEVKGIWDLKKMRSKNTISIKGSISIRAF